MNIQEKYIIGSYNQIQYILSLHQVSYIIENKNLDIQPYFNSFVHDDIVIKVISPVDNVCVSEIMPSVEFMIAFQQKDGQYYALPTNDIQYIAGLVDIQSSIQISDQPNNWTSLPTNSDKTFMFMI